MSAFGGSGNKVTVDPLSFPRRSTQDAPKRPSSASAVRQLPADSSKEAVCSNEAKAKDPLFEALRDRAKGQQFENSDDFVICERTSHPGVLVARRSMKSRERSPERLHLDRRKLDRCLSLQDEDKLRLLNYQNNAISRIEHLGNLPSLVFLDLYDNKVQQIENLEFCKNMRVLMLGKNQITSIEKLEALKHLDVLDLHSNRINEIKNLGHLSCLRVLNLAGNQLREIQSLSGLRSLSELNIRRNSLLNIEGIQGVPQLQRLFASHNRISVLEGVVELGCLKQVKEVALDGNPVSGNFSKVYRGHIVSLCPSLENLDGKEVSNQDREDSRHPDPDHSSQNVNLKLNSSWSPPDQLATQMSTDICMNGGVSPELPTKASESGWKADFQTLGQQASAVIMAEHTEENTDGIAQTCEHKDTTRVAMQRRLSTGSTKLSTGAQSATSAAITTIGGSTRVNFSPRTSAEEQSCEENLTPIASPTEASTVFAASANSPEEDVPISSATPTLSEGRASLKEPVSASKDAKSADSPGTASAATGRVSTTPKPHTPSQSAPKAGHRDSSDISGVPTDSSAFGASERPELEGKKRTERPQLPKASSPSLGKRGTGKVTAGSSKALTSVEVMKEIKTQWMQLVLGGHAATTRHGYVKRERITELAIYGRGLEALDKPEYQGVVTSLHFYYITIDVLLNEMTRISRFRELTTLTFKRNEIVRPQQLAALATLKNLQNLVVEENPINEGRPNLRANILQLLPKLRDINGTKVDCFERVDVEKFSQEPLDDEGLACFATSSENYVSNRSESQADEINSMLMSLVAHSCAVDDRIAAVNQYFQDVVKDAISEAWDDVIAMERSLPSENAIQQQMNQFARPMPVAPPKGRPGGGPKRRFAN
eukprot:TRINITY_DN13012_c1_g1_i1.p1 TRINITY_DN13012_c1_g1~~TRINITY_DN13012_c1_g1_i1.p1  ORF type:complete len:884 (+),score=159.60 TRINITY_DN13012_c1_g1_i1:180-2831(+)